MQHLIQQLIKICLFTAKPQDLTTSNRYLVMCAIASFISYQIGNAVLSNSAKVVFISMTQAILLGAGLWLLLQLFKKPQRWLQSATALYGTSAVTHLAALPVIVWVANTRDSLEQFSTPMWGFALFRIWFFAVMVYVLKETLEISIGLSLVIALVLQFVFALILVGLFGTQLA